MVGPSPQALETGLASAADALERAGLPRDVAIVAYACCPLGEFPERGVSSAADALAASVVGIVSPCPGGVLLALEPRPALEWVRGGPLPAPWEWEPGDSRRVVATFVEAAGAIAQAFAAALLPAAQCGAPQLSEDSLPALLVGTHAPRDALVVSAELALPRADGETARAWLCLLVDAKHLPARESE